MKHFIDIDNFNKVELRKILSYAKKIKKNKNKGISHLKNKFLGMIFEKKSMRTRLSFDIGMKRLGGNVIELDPKQIGYGTRESEEDILKVMSQYLDILMIRNDNHKQLMSLASKNILPIINGLSDFSHPCQILSDIFTIEENKGSIKDNKIVWLGDFNNVLISLIQAAELLEFELNILMPKELIKKEKIFFKKKELNYTNFYNDIDIGMRDASCVMTDVWISMGEKKLKRKVKLLRDYKVDKHIMNKAKKNAIFMHCLPAHRGEEVTDEVMDSKQSVVWQQAQNRMYVQQSIINYLLNYDKI